MTVVEVVQEMYEVKWVIGIEVVEVQLVVVVVVNSLERQRHLELPEREAHEVVEVEAGHDLKMEKQETIKDEDMKEEEEGLEKVDHLMRQMEKQRT